MVSPRRQVGHAFKENIVAVTANYIKGLISDGMSIGRIDKKETEDVL